jgi:hypothetical protein
MGDRRRTGAARWPPEARRRSSRRRRRASDGRRCRAHSRRPRRAAAQRAVAAVPDSSERTGIETVLQCSARDRSLLDLQSDLLGAAREWAFGKHRPGHRRCAAGRRLLRCDRRPSTLIRFGLLNAVSRFNHGADDRRDRRSASRPRFILA